MRGFFTKQETHSNKYVKGRLLSCSRCGLGGSLRHKMKPTGNFKKNILLIGHSNTEIEIERQKHWNNKAGRLLRQTLTDFEIDLSEDCLTINAVCCPVHKTLTTHQIDCCRNTVFQIIKEYKPQIIIPLGIEATYSVIGMQWKKDFNSIQKWRGQVIPDQELKSWICPTFHPMFMHDQEQSTKIIWENDLRHALSFLNVPFLQSSGPVIEIIDSLKPLENITSDLISIDFETTGIKPHAPGHRIICASVADTPDHCYAFMIPKSRKEQKPFLDLLENENIGKMAHNMKFEHTWAENRLRTEIKNWQWDSMLASHVIDNRPGITGLKFQTYINFGVVDYSSEVSPYFSSGTGNANGINQIHKLVNTHGGETQLLEYCGLDTIYQYRLALKQMKILGYENNS